MEIDLALQVLQTSFLIFYFIFNFFATRLLVHTFLPSFYIGKQDLLLIFFRLRFPISGNILFEGTRRILGKPIGTALFPFG